MVELGADIFATTIDGRTLMRVVLERGSETQIEMLIEKGLDLQEKKDKLSALEYMLFTKPNDYIFLLERVEFLLEKGSVVTDKSLKLIANLRNNFEIDKDNFDSNTQLEYRNALDKITQLLEKNNKL